MIEEQDFSDEEHRPRQLPESPRAQPFLGRMRERRMGFEDRMDERYSQDEEEGKEKEVMQAISVRRQRKLKMKKHKYKKLMKRTKNLRRRLDRT